MKKIQVKTPTENIRKQKKQIKDTADTYIRRMIKDLDNIQQRTQNLKRTPYIKKQKKSIDQLYTTINIQKHFQSIG